MYIINLFPSLYQWQGKILVSPYTLPKFWWYNKASLRQRVAFGNQGWIQVFRGGYPVYVFTLSDTLMPPKVGEYSWKGGGQDPFVTSPKSTTGNPRQASTGFNSGSLMDKIVHQELSRFYSGRLDMAYLIS